MMLTIFKRLAAGISPTRASQQAGAFSSRPSPATKRTSAEYMAMISGDRVLDLTLGQLATRSDFSPEKMKATCDAMNHKYYEVNK